MKYLSPKKSPYVGLLMAIVALFIFGCTANNKNEIIFKEINSMNKAEFINHIKDKPNCILFLSMKNCPPCTSQYREVSKFAKENNIPVYKIDKDSNQLLTKEYNIEMEFPLIVVFNCGKQVSCNNGFDLKNFKQTLNNNPCQ
jgi:hypothetical protein